jgi:hypothetical protein
MSLREIVSAVIATIVILAFLSIILIDVATGRPIVLPDALLVLVSLVSGVYLGQHAATNGAYQAGANAATTAASVAANLVANQSVKPPGPGV